MKKLPLIIMFLVILPCCFGQDIIVKKDKKELSARVTERTATEVKFYMVGQASGVLYTMKLRDISSIKYSTGVVDLAGNENPRKNKPLGISIGPGLDPREGVSLGYWHLSADYFVIPQVDIEINAGSSDIEMMDNMLYFTAGATAHLNRSNSHSPITPYVGLLFGAWNQMEVIQVPMGIRYCGKTGFSASLRVSPMIISRVMPMVPLELKIGWRFR